ncbi:MAG TPA: hypothetical protein VK911_04955 [Vicinamibacterales bacterium]|nr:hypothetical protein [Vicinamibacterales bacterium]
MYEMVLALHSLLRWLVVLVGVWAVVAAFSAARRREWTPSDARPGFLFVLGLDLQIVIGLALFLFLSPITRAALQDVGGAMQNAASRFWLVEHPALMIVAAVLAHVGRGAARKAGSYRAAGRARLWYLLALLAVLIAAPWPFTGQARPWFRLF